MHMTSGTRPVFTEFVVKLASRCNLNCDYCYMYNLADTSWRTQPRLMSADTLLRLSARIGTYARQRHLSDVTVHLHGGEPLLAGPQLLDQACGLLRTMIVSRRTRLRLRVVTNGILLANPEILAVLHRHGVEVSVSLDGDQEATGRHRRYANGRNSWEDVTTGLQALAAGPGRDLPLKLISVIDVTADPAGTYDALAPFARHGSLDFLFPLATWDSPPPWLGEGPVLGRWVTALYDHWLAQPGRPQIRLFNVLRDQLSGTDTRVGFMGPQPDRAALVVNTDGSWERIDSMRIIGDGMAVTGLTVRHHALRKIERLPDIAATPPAAECLACPLFIPCGGRYFVERWGDGSYDHPSVYCQDMKVIIPHIARSLAASPAA